MKAIDLFATTIFALGVLLLQQSQSLAIPAPEECGPICKLVYVSALCPVNGIPNVTCVVFDDPTCLHCKGTIPQGNCVLQWSVTNACIEMETLNPHRLADCDHCECKKGILTAEGWSARNLGTIDTNNPLNHYECVVY